jgi:hypothetical protein
MDFRETVSGHYDPELRKNAPSCFGPPSISGFIRSRYHFNIKMLRLERAAVRGGFFLGTELVFSGDGNALEPHWFIV